MVESSGGQRPVDRSEIVAARHREVLQRFAVRARRVEVHSLAADKQRLMARARGTIQVTFEAESGKAAMSWDLPDEEVLDSLAARCRPFLLNGDPVYHAKVTNALGFFIQNAPDSLRQDHQSPCLAG